jgi:hypothetical protein
MGRTACPFDTVSVALTVAAQLRADGIVQVTKNVRFDIKEMNISSFHVHTNRNSAVKIKFL